VAHPRTPDQLAAHALEQRLRREMAARTGHALESFPRDVVHAQTKGKCTVCRKPVRFEEDWHEEHIVSIINGGKNDLSNIGPAHAPCNLAKGRG
jgi:5-methylcytosine-specific restriction endonuclease McrA